MEDGSSSLFSRSEDITSIVYQLQDLLKVWKCPQFLEIDAFGGIVGGVMAWSSQRRNHDQSTSYRIIQCCPFLRLGPASIARKASARGSRSGSTLRDGEKIKSESDCKKNGKRSHCGENEEGKDTERS